MNIAAIFQRTFRNTKATDMADQKDDQQNGKLVINDFDEMFRYIGGWGK